MNAKAIKLKLEYQKKEPEDIADYLAAHPYTEGSQCRVMSAVCKLGFF